jgi:malonate transporter
VLAILLITFPFFALVLCGYVAARRGMLPLEAIPGLNAFVLYFALPCMLYRFGASTPVAQLLDIAAVAVYLPVRADHGGCHRAVQPERARALERCAFGALVAAFPNTGFMGVPLLVALLGAAAAGPAILTILLDLVITTSLCIALSRLDGADEHGAAKAAKAPSRAWRPTPCPGPSWPAPWRRGCSWSPSSR